jgi:ABC-type multidrug transport system fused ATPase/permease subunit
MRLLLKAALKNRKHLLLFVFTFLSLISLSIADTLEVSALGLIMNFSKVIEGSSNTVISAISSSSLEHKEINPLNWMIDQLKVYFTNAENFHVLIGVLIGVAIFKAITLFTSRYMSQVLAIRISRDLRLQYFEHIQSLPMSFYQKYNIGSLSSRVVGDAGQIANSLNSVIGNYMHMPFTVVSSLLICFYISWQLSCVIFIAFPLVILPIIFLAKRLKRVSRQLQSNQEKFASVLIDFLAGIQTVKIFAMEMFSFKKYKEQNDRMAVLEGKTAKYGFLTRPILHAITTACCAVVFIFGLHNLKMTITELLVFCGILQRAYETLKKFGDENANIQKGVVAAERMFEVLNLKPEIEDHKGSTDLLDFEDKIEFDHVWFRYGEEWILKDVSFTVNKGETVALVGPTGSGKSTIVQLLPRLYEVQKGEIRINGKPLNSYTQKSLREKLAFVSQKPFLFSDTIAANIGFGRNFSREEIALAAKKAHAEEFISQLPLKYDSVLAEAGQNLSGGQQQRLAIARALVKKAPILILDEATSSLDALSEQRIKDAITSLHRSVTQIIIAHRLGTIEHADKIVYIERGVKVAEGTKDELLRDCEQFRLTWETLYRIESYPAQTSVQ